MYPSLISISIHSNLLSFSSIRILILMKINTTTCICITSLQDYGESFQAGDVISCLCDRDEGVISFHKNGRDMGV